jgi:hypothetical protein
MLLTRGLNVRNWPAVQLREIQSNSSEVHKGGQTRAEQCDTLNLLSSLKRKKKG